MTDIAASVFDLLVAEEGLDQPSRWPGHMSGISLGRGYDLGYHTRQHFRMAWDRHLSAADIAMLETSIGVKGDAAAAMAPRFRRIRVTVEQANEVLARVTVPEWIATTRAAFPGFETLPADAQVALVSLTYNRGPGMGNRKNPKSWDQRREMRAIRQLVAGGCADKLRLIAQELRAMKRLWPTSKGLRDRREREARMVEGAA